MPLPVPNLDDRRFDDLVAEARQRLASHLPELTQIAPGDPVHAFVDLFAWLTEIILYRANLIPERQRRVILNLLQVPLRPARPARGLVCVDPPPTAVQPPPPLPDGAQVSGAGLTFSTRGEVQPLPLELAVLIKESVDDATLARLGLDRAALRQQHGLRETDPVDPFNPRAFDLGKEPLSLKNSIDRAYYLALAVPRGLQSQVGAVRQALAGLTLSLALAPDDARLGDQAEDPRDRPLIWELISEDAGGTLRFLPLEVLADGSGGGRRLGVARLKLPRNAALFQPLAVGDPLFAGVGERPPELPRQIAPQRVAFWLRLRCPEEPSLSLGYLGVNGVDLVGQGTRRDRLIGTGTGRPDQVLDLPDTDIDAESLALDLAEGGAWVRWSQVETLYGQAAEARCYRLDPQAGRVFFGDGLCGRRPPEGASIRAALYRHGGGAAGNLAPGALKSVQGGADGLVLRHEWPSSGGVDAESLAQAERRIPQFLTHRNRAVTREDFRLLALATPTNPVARAEVVQGLVPGASIGALRRGVPGVISVFVLPPGPPVLGHTPKPSQGLLKDCFGYLIDRVLVGTELYVLSPEFRPLAVGVRVEVRDPSTEQQTLAQVRQALVDHLWVLAPGGVEGTGWPLGGAVRAKELATQVARVAGVRSVNRLSLFLPSGSLWQRLPDDAEIALLDYQLPEVLGVSVGTGGADPDLPLGLEAADGGPGALPTPVIPDLC